MPGSQARAAANANAWVRPNSSAPAAAAAMPASRATFQIQFPPSEQAAWRWTIFGSVQAMRAGSSSAEGRAGARPELPNAGACLSVGTERKSRPVRTMGLTNPSGSAAKFRRRAAACRQVEEQLDETIRGGGLLGVGLRQPGKPFPSTLVGPELTRRCSRG